MAVIPVDIGFHKLAVIEVALYRDRFHCTTCTRHCHNVASRYWGWCVAIGAPEY